ncbi:TolC family protein, partial [Pseudomonas sp. BIOMIG1BD]
MRTPAFTVSALLIALALGGCSMAPTYERPTAPVADSWSDSPAQQGRQASELDWQAFIVDPELRRLVGTALDNNRSLRQTLLDIDQARAQYRIQRADRIPGLNAGASGNRQRLPADLSSKGQSSVASTYQVGLSLPEYEVDLFG